MALLVRLALLALLRPTGAVTLALQGGGIRALASDAGLVAGIARVSHLSHLSHNESINKQSGDSDQTKMDTLNVMRVLQNFDTVSSVSGSSWFAAELFFSNSFVELLKGIASSPFTASVQFDQQWIQPWLLATDVQEPKFDGIQSLVRLWVKLLLGTGDEDTIFLAQFFFASGLSWNHFVDVLLKSTAGISVDRQMGSTPVSGASHTWLVDHTVLLPTSGACIRQGKLIFPRVTYGAAADGVLPAYLPAKFSIKLGSGTNSSAPLSYIALPEEPIQFNFRGLCLGCSSASSGALYVDMANGSLINSTGAFPVVQTVAASSAVFGSAISGFVFSEIAAQLTAEVAVWIGTKGFEAADKLYDTLQSHVDADLMSELGKTAFHALIDGGFSDGTGIAQAVSAGASEVVVVLNSFSTNQPEYVAQLFQGGTVVKPAVPKELFPVFQSPSASAVQTAFTEFETLKLHNSSYLKVIAFGKIQATTAENKFFGIQGGRHVTLNIINICSELSIGFFANFENYGHLVQEVALTISDPANRDVVLSQLMPLFDSSLNSFRSFQSTPSLRRQFI